MRELKQKTVIKIIQFMSSFPSEVAIEDIETALADSIPRRTLQRWLSEMEKLDQITITGMTRGRRYRLVKHSNSEDSRKNYSSSLLPLSAESKRALALVTLPIQKRKLVGYNQEFLKSYRPNVSHYLSSTQKKHLAKIGDTKILQPAGRYAMQILNRLLIDLSWNSSRLEGNTYSLLGTERLIDLGEADGDKSAKEAQMILNHKDAIEFIVHSAADIGYNRYTFLNLHAMLSNNLLPDPHAPGRLRTMAVGIGESSFTPLAICQLISEYFDLILAKAAEIEDPFEQSFFLMVHLPYLQPFDDVNKRVSRLAANIPLVKGNYSPLSFIDVPENLYIFGVKAVHEQNDISLLRDVFLWAYERSAAKYAVIKQSIGEPDAFKLKYRTSIRELITSIILGQGSSAEGIKMIRAAAEEIVEEDRTEFITAVETEIQAIHEGNFARYRVSPSEFSNWKVGWK